MQSFPELRGGNGLLRVSEKRSIFTRSEYLFRNKSREIYKSGNFKCLK